MVMFSRTVTVSTFISRRRCLPGRTAPHPDAGDPVCRARTGSRNDLVRQIGDKIGNIIDVERTRRDHEFRTVHLLDEVEAHRLGYLEQHLARHLGSTSAQTG